jgi:hypothetical protein
LIFSKLHVFTYQKIKHNGQRLVEDQLIKYVLVK